MENISGLKRTGGVFKGNSSQVNLPQPLAFLISTSAARSVGYYLCNPHSKIGCSSACDHR